MSENLPALQQRAFSIDEIRDVSAALARSGLFGIKTPEQAFALALVADAEGLHPATVAQDYDVIQGRPARKTHSVLARFQAAGGKVEWHELTDTKADATFSHPRGGSVRIDWTIEQAKKANLAGKDNWKSYPRAMLRSRCIGEGVRACFPAALGGALLVEEAQDLDPLTIDATTGVISGGAAPAPAFNVQRKPKPPAPPAEVVDAEPAGEQQAAAPKPEQQAEQQQTEGGEKLVGLGEIAFLRKKAAANEIDLDKVLADLGGLVLEKLTKTDFDRVKAELNKAAG